MLRKSCFKTSWVLASIISFGIGLVAAGGGPNPTKSVAPHHGKPPPVYDHGLLLTPTKIDVGSLPRYQIKEYTKTTARLIIGWSGYYYGSIEKCGGPTNGIASREDIIKEYGSFTGEDWDPETFYENMRAAGSNSVCSKNEKEALAGTLRSLFAVWETLNGELSKRNLFERSA